ncbi:hypothetical protein Pla110_06830 [Polystyrenella longa]|uniref:Uncharacterized protein n=1 Tax=Polystyrenella longa TaxID=2528007 RepID=A0A518CIC1_9PLAN|nr:hypothetical protein [Polystyrenella longa]QDU78979.1 hypothetical protein Pla110_06830 [Polystyrenella longa]
MTDLSVLISEDLELCFMDWGTDVTLRAVAEVFDVESQLVNETYEDAPAVAIPGVAHVGVTKGTAGQHFEGRMSFFLKKEDYPFDVVVNNGRLKHAGQWYRIEGVEERGANLLQLSCRRMEELVDEI